MANLIGKKLGQYHIRETAGRGGMATVYRAYDPKADREVAVKVLSPYIAQEPKFKARFVQEANLLVDLRHPNIVPVLDYGEENGFAYIVMPYMTAGTLAERLNKGPLPLSVANEVLQQLAGAIDYAHSNKVIHRDIKPSNILIDEGGRAMITDFGFARVADESLSITGSGLIGTPAYMSPEQCRGEDASRLSDQYGFGVVLYQMTTGSLPFEADTPLGVVIMHATEPLPPPREINPELPRRVEAVIMKALDKEPGNRYPSMVALKEAFHLAISEKAGPIRQAVFDHPTEVLNGFAVRWAKFRIKLRDAWKPSTIIFLALLAAGFVSYSLLAAEGTPTVNASPTEISADLLATIDVLKTANAPVEGTILAPGEIETAVAGTMSALQATVARTTEASSTATETQQPEGTPTSTTQFPLATSTPSQTPTSTQSTLTVMPSESPTETLTETPTETPSPDFTIDPTKCKPPGHPTFACTPTPTQTPP